MYQIKMQKNKDFIEKRCFLTNDIFRPSGVTVSLMEKHNKKFKLIGLIHPMHIKEFDLWRKNFEEEGGDETSLYIETCSNKIYSRIYKKEEVINFLEATINNLKDEIWALKKVVVKQESVANGKGGKHLAFPTWNEYQKAVRGCKE